MVPTQKFGWYSPKLIKKALQLAHVLFPSTTSQPHQTTNTIANSTTNKQFAKPTNNTLSVKIHTVTTRGVHLKAMTRNHVSAF
jgi:hypothetical protein